VGIWRIDGIAGWEFGKSRRIFYVPPFWAVNATRPARPLIFEQICLGTWTANDFQHLQDVRFLLNDLAFVVKDVGELHFASHSITRMQPKFTSVWVTGSPTIAATCPQTALPIVIAPKNTVTNIASPRPRTQSGNAT
jgi:hypothetical protein